MSEQLLSTELGDEPPESRNMLTAGTNVSPEPRSETVLKVEAGSASCMDD